MKIGSLVCLEKIARGRIMENEVGICNKLSFFEINNKKIKTAGTSVMLE